jgi:hypothetical protein
VPFSMVNIIQRYSGIEVAKRYGIAWKIGDREKIGITSPDFCLRSSSRRFDNHLRKRGFFALSVRYYAPNGPYA